MLDEEKHGTGEYRYADGTVYSGQWHRGMRQGFGILTALDDAAYEGETSTLNGLTFLVSSPQTFTLTWERKHVGVREPVTV